MHKKILTLLGILFTVVFLVSNYFLVSTVININNGNYLKAKKTAQISLLTVKPLSKVTLNKNTSIELLKSSLVLIVEIPSYIDELSNITNLEDRNQNILDIKKLKNILSDLNIQIETINDLLGKPSIIKRILPDKYIEDSDKVSTSLADFISVLEQFSNKDQKIIIVFQNSDEIRATGGFMGSYAVVDIINGQITEIKTEDIYDADGQFTGNVEAPDGVKEYLSDGEGLRLPNANWHPNFPSSSEQILQFFALGNKKNVTTLVAINPKYAQVILEITGDIILKDYNTVVDSNNINEVLRSRRDAFFPGSKQKKHLISQLLTQLQIKFKKLGTEDKIDIFKQTYVQLINNNIQLYSAVDEVNNIFSKYKFRQELEYKDNTEYLFLIESNVGINKANKGIIRDVKVKLSNFDSLVSVNFKNNNFIPSVSNLTELLEAGNKTNELNKLNNEKEDNNEQKNNNIKTPPNHLSYVNYQRVIVNPNWNLELIQYNGEPILEWNENIITNSSGDKFKEIGFIITLKEQESSILEIGFKNSQLNQAQIYIQKQPGIPETPYVVKKDEFVIQELIEGDFLFEVY